VSFVHNILTTRKDSSGVTEEGSHILADFPDQRVPNTILLQSAISYSYSCRNGSILHLYGTVSHVVLWKTHLNERKVRYQNTYLTWH